MRSILMFDLPVETVAQRRNYRKFIKFLKTNGFIMFQESIYIKLSINEASVKSTISLIKSNLPKDGNISMLTVTEKQFANIEYFLGDFEATIINSDARYIEL